MDVSTIITSVLGSVVVATAVAKVFDARAAKREEERADRAADKALLRKWHDDEATRKLERLSRQINTVDTVLGHVTFLDSKTQWGPQLSAAEFASALATRPGAEEADLGRLQDTPDGRKIVLLYNRCKELFRGGARLPVTRDRLGDWRSSVAELHEAVQRWWAL
jgi:hypothetical protein